MVRLPSHFPIKDAGNTIATIIIPIRSILELDEHGFAPSGDDRRVGLPSIDDVEIPQFQTFAVFHVERRDEFHVPDGHHEAQVKRAPEAARISMTE